MRRGGNRAVTVQIGAVLLLAILFSALALYQVNAVPAENEVVEIEHNQEVHDEMQDLRNAVRAVGAGGGSQPTTVTLGTQYPTRTLTANPPPPAGTLETSEAGSLEIENAEVSERVGEYDESQLEALVLGTHDTRTLSYEPGYNEYRGAPTTRIEHSLAFNDFGDATVVLPGADQRLVDGDSITVVLLEGNLSATSTGSVTVDPVADGPTDPVPIERESDGIPITITLPTETPAAWNETFADESAVTVDSYDETAGALTIELTENEYDLQVSRVAVGDGDPGSEFGGVEDRAPSTGGDETLPGPRVSPAVDDEVEKGDDATVTVELDNRGDPSDPDERRGGVALLEADWDLEGEPQGETVEMTDPPADGSLSDSVELIEPSGGGNEMSYAELSIEVDTSGLEVGETYTVSVGAADTRGIEEARALVSFEVIDDEDDGDDGDDGDNGDDDNGDDAQPPDDAVAYHDESGTGEYEEGEESFTAEELESFDRDSVDLVVFRDATTSIDGFDISANSVTVEPGVTLDTGEGWHDITVEADESITASESVFQADSPITVESGGDIDVVDTTISTDSGGATIDVDAGGSLTATGTNIESSDLLSLESEDDIDVTDAEITTSDGGEDIQVDAGGSLTATGAGIETSSPISLESEDDMDLSGAEIATEANGADITISAGSDIDITDGEITTEGNGADITISAEGDVEATEAVITTGGNGADITISAAGDIDITEGEITTEANGADITISAEGEVHDDGAELDAGGSLDVD
ncbi:hypothetical protein [Natrialba sp. INN-245]|uniref:hypothetical protein n=1 Tax=Natrialba sp. INN-245 TaxID=2690967 RepID=UPI0013116A54|nr:hypothetical protein [Natrialba sp. INN-245]MWV39445.1 hypothetical protein [Natrialba sp. INN-245]